MKLLRDQGTPRSSAALLRQAGFDCRVLQNVIQQCLADLDRGAMLSVQENRIRVHRLPVA
jgi:hypothetical protein